MSREQDGDVHGPGWRDVREMMREVSSATNLRIDIHCTAAMGENRSDKLVWSVRAWEWGKWGEGTPYAHKTALWPSNGYNTVPTMLYGLLLLLDSQIEEARARAMRHGPTRLPGT